MYTIMDPKNDALYDAGAIDTTFVSNEKPAFYDAGVHDTTLEGIQ